MFAALTLSRLLAVAPAPTPTRPPVIVRTITTARCTTLHEMMPSIGYVTRRHDDASNQASPLAHRPHVGTIGPCKKALQYRTPASQRMLLLAQVIC